MGTYWYFQHLLLDTASIHTARYNCAHSKAYHPERETFYSIGKQSLRVLLKVIHQVSDRVDHSVNLSFHFSSSAVNHHLNSAGKELIYFTPSFNLTNGVDARFTRTAWAHTHRALEMWRDEAGDECDLTENPLLCERFTSLESTHSEHRLLARCSDIQKEIRTRMLLLLSTLVLIHHSTVLFWFCLYS